MAVQVKRPFNYDDALDVVGVHGVGGVIGALGTGVFASLAINGAGANGLIYGNVHLLLMQAVAVGAVILYSFTVSFVLLKLINHFCGLRVTEEHEEVGLDLTQHSEAGYAW